MGMNKCSVYAFLAGCALFAIFSPLPDNQTYRSLTAMDDTSTAQQASRELQAAPTPPPAVAFSCPPGKVETKVEWGNTPVQSNTSPQSVTLSNGVKATISYKATAPGFVSFFGFDKTGYLKLTAGTTVDSTDIVGPQGTTNPDYPAGYGTMVLEFEEEIDGLFISIGDVDSGSQTGDAVRIRMYDAAGGTTSTSITKTGNIQVKDNFAYESQTKQSAKNPGFGSSLYAKANGGVKRIEMDQSVFAYKSNAVGKNMKRSIYPASDFAYCADPETPSPTPPPLDPTFSPTVKPTPFPTPIIPVPYPDDPEMDVLLDIPPSDPPTPDPTNPPTNPPTPDPTNPPTPGPTNPPTPDPTNPPTPEPTLDVGVNGDPMMMGLSGQVFKFDGRPGSWYSAVSAKSFQWNIKIQQFEGCPDSSDTFIIGTGLNLLAGKKKHKIAINVDNEHQTDVGCGRSPFGKHKEYNCLGAGSLQVAIDGHKISQAGDYNLNDGTGRVIAFNTVAKCSRRWFDFDLTPKEEIKSIMSRRLRHHRHLKSATVQQSEVLDLLEQVKGKMIDRDGCTEWMRERREKNDLFQQTGTWATIMIITDTVSFHIEYKQEQERCDAHSLDMWISSVNPKVLDEDWEGIIGDTKKGKPFLTTEHKHVDRKRVLKYADDNAYEVIAPFSLKCKACVRR